MLTVLAERIRNHNANDRVIKTVAICCPGFSCMCGIYVGSALGPHGGKIISRLVLLCNWLEV